MRSLFCAFLGGAGFCDVDNFIGGGEMREENNYLEAHYENLLDKYQTKICELSAAVEYSLRFLYEIEKELLSESARGKMEKVRNLLKEIQR